MSDAIDIEKEAKRVFGGAKAMTADEEEKWEWQNSILPHLRATRLPEPYFYEVENWNKDQKAAYSQCQELLKQAGAIVALVGERGIGKTTIAAQLIIDRARDITLEPWKRRPPYRKASEIVARFKALFADYGSVQTERLLQRFRDYSAFPLLVIDEWHECEELKTRDRVMTDLLDRRYAANNDTILISNQTAEEFIASTNESTVSRLSESGAIIRCEWPSFRNK